MRTPVRLGLFAALLVAAGSSAYAVGTVTGTVLPQPVAAHGAAMDDGHGGAAGSDVPQGVTGLAIADDGLVLRLERTVFTTGTQPFRFTVEDDAGMPLTAYDATHERDLHLVVVRRDLTRFQHLHPVLAADGAWEVPLTLDAPGPYRVYADFAPAGRAARALAVDVTVPGAYLPAADASGERRTSTGGGYSVTVDGALVAGKQSRLSFVVRRQGADVTGDLDDYLGAKGHLVVLREGDLAYLHVHPEGEGLSFETMVPSPGRYSAFLGTSHDGVVRTADLRLETSS